MGMRRGEWIRVRCTGMCLDLMPGKRGSGNVMRPRVQMGWKSFHSKQIVIELKLEAYTMWDVVWKSEWEM
jgi:hypothetical protein